MWSFPVGEEDFNSLYVDDAGEPYEVRELAFEVTSPKVVSNAKPRLIGCDTIRGVKCTKLLLCFASRGGQESA